nr:hypothetical protein [Tanacetum cinerariifolium]GEX78429.1 hypothetical protein [Tanacetum cinerariifolium]
MDQNIDFSGSDQIQTPQYPDVHSQEISNEVFQANHSIQNEESLENSSDEIDVSNSNVEKEKPPQDSDIRQFIREECCVEASEEQKQMNAECEVTLEDKRDCDVPVSSIDVCDDHSDIFSDSKIDDDISVYDNDFEDIEYVEASLSDSEIVNQEEENDVYQYEEEIDLEDISQIQDVVLREKLLSIIRLISNNESLNDNSTPDRVLNSFKSDNSLLNYFSPEFDTFCDHSKETRSGNTIHADYSLPEYESFCFEIKPDQERLIYDIPDDSSNDPLLEEAVLFLSDNSIPPGDEIPVVMNE